MTFEIDLLISRQWIVGLVDSSREVHEYESMDSLDETCLRKNDEDENNEDENKVEEPSYGDLLLQQLKSCLAGVPPPLQFTYPQYKIEDMLESLKKYEGINAETKQPGLLHQKINCDQIVGSQCQWPDIKKCLFFDISYNVSQSTEKLVDLYDAYRQRYVGCETASFVTANSPSKYSYKKKDRRKVLGRSPRRQSYLARRRKIFSSSSLQEACEKNSFGVTKKTILMTGNSKKKSSSQTKTKRALFSNANEQRNYRLEAMKRSPGKAKSLWLQRNLPKRSTPRKQTPTKTGTPRKCTTPGKDGTPRKCSTSGKSGTPRKRTTPGRDGTPRMCTTPRKNVTPRKHATPRKSDNYKNLNENGKRSRSEMESKNETGTQSAELSDTQRRKLLWAVASALGEVGVKRDHSLFRSYGRRLFRVCKQMWTQNSKNRSLSHGVSEQMLSMASEKVPVVMKEVDDETKNTAENPDLFSQDSNSCDFFLNINNR